jgi:hypothetical protein
MSNLKYTLKVSHDRHLLVKLWRLSKTSWFAEVVQTEYVGSSLGTASDQFRSVDFGELISVTELSEKLAYSSL